MNSGLISEGLVYIKAAVWGICFAKPCGTLGKQQRIKLSWGKLADSSKHSVLLNVGSKYGGEGLPWLLDEGPSRLENFTFPMAGTNHMAR